MRLALELDRETVAPGETLTGRVRVLEGGESRSLALTVSFVERSPHYTVPAFAQSGVLYEGALTAGQEVPFEYAIPDWALPGVKTGHAELLWQLEARSDEPGLDTSARSDFQVAPPA